MFGLWCLPVLVSTARMHFPLIMYPWFTLLVSNFQYYSIIVAFALLLPWPPECLPV